MPIDYPNQELLHTDDFAQGFDLWHHEGIGEIKPAPAPAPGSESESETGGMRLHCFGSKQGGRGCMAFFRPTLPDQIAIEYDLVIQSRGGLLINYMAIRGQNGEDMIEDRDKLEPRTGIMANYYANKWGLQSYHVSISRFNDDGEHTGTSNWRRNPGSLLVGHGIDPIMNMQQTYHVRVVKDEGSCQLEVDGRFSYAFVDRDVSRRPIPDFGKFGFRLIGSDVMADIRNFTVHRIKPDPGVRKNHEDYTGRPGRSDTAKAPTPPEQASGKD